MVTRREADRVFRELLPAHLQRARLVKRDEWFQSLTIEERLMFMDRVRGEIINQYGELPRPKDPRKRFPGADIQILSLPKKKRRRQRTPRG